MNYKLVEIDKENQAILVDVDGWSIWIDYWKENEEEGYLWDFNQFIFYEYSLRDIRTKQIHNKIMNNDDNLQDFNYFMDSIFCDYADKL